MVHRPETPPGHGRKATVAIIDGKLNKVHITPTRPGLAFARLWRVRRLMLRRDDGSRRFIQSPGTISGSADHGRQSTMSARRHDGGEVLGP